MQHETILTTGAYTCHRCGRVVQFRAHGAIGVWLCSHCGGQNSVRRRTPDRERTRIEIESHDTQTIPADYGFE